MYEHFIICVFSVIFQPYFRLLYQASESFVQDPYWTSAPVPCWGNFVPGPLILSP